jgi:arsenate reductase (thioredoxin)
VLKPIQSLSGTWGSSRNSDKAVVNRGASSTAAQVKGREMPKQKVLFICVHNSARSQMAAALMNKTCGEFFEAQSAGLEPGSLNPLAVEVLQELGIDISQNQTRAVFDVWKSGQIFKYVITVCSETEVTGCPIFAGVTTRLHWPFDDPAQFKGPHEERLRETRRVRDQIHAKIDSFCNEHCIAESSR